MIQAKSFATSNEIFFKQERGARFTDLTDVYVIALEAYHPRYKAWGKLQRQYVLYDVHPVHEIKQATINFSVNLLYNIEHMRTGKQMPKLSTTKVRSPILHEFQMWLELYAHRIQIAFKTYAFLTASGQSTLDFAELLLQPLLPLVRNRVVGSITCIMSTQRIRGRVQGRIAGGSRNFSVPPVQSNKVVHILPDSRYDFSHVRRSPDEFGRFLHVAKHSRGIILVISCHVRLGWTRNSWAAGDQARSNRSRGDA